MVADGVRHVAHLGAVADVADERLYIHVGGPELRARFGERLLLDVEHGDVDSGARQRAHDPEPDAGCGPGDHRNPVLYVLHRFPLLPWPIGGVPAGNASMLGR